MKNWIEISAGRLAANYKTLTESVGAAISVLAVIKADAYGHGAALCAPVLAGAGAEWLGVTDARQGREVREALVAAGSPRERQGREVREALVAAGSPR